MKKNFTKIFTKFLLILIIIQIGISSSSQIANKLWGQESLGEISEIKFQDSTNFLISTKSGLISTYDLNLKKILYKKNYLYENNFILDTTENCIKFFLNFFLKFFFKFFLFF
jgi:hypothetical protein